MQFAVFHFLNFSRKYNPVFDFLSASPISILHRGRVVSAGRNISVIELEKEK